ncbi:hypothetical protein [Desulfosporosinus sp.]|uniref:hypothetical protein n=1 Tax=Desulfosporosinus sp. TaxID=157907 RepID=UPI0025B941E2|nr:hypothetical protein [Desulfosporosinus sp.]MBC2722041.1 hypothetical protein [Desulfosporosinus sp.]MBC2728024.1 hypothetical protein [Desulfosporosinus sp.]
MKLFGIGPDLSYNSFKVWKEDNFNPSTKVDKSGDTMGGKLGLPASTVDGAPLNIPHGTTPTTLVNGDIWTTTSSIIARINGVTRTMAHTSTWSTVSQAEAEAGTATTNRLWTALRVAQAIAVRLPTKLSQLENDIGAGAGLNIIPSPTEPTLNTGDWWYQEL